jgi:biopolymer transport protein ExbB/TolQ
MILTSDASTLALAVILPLVIGLISAIGAILGVRQNQRQYEKKEQDAKKVREQEREDERREINRREDQLWGYLDSQGIRHVGVVETVATLQKAFEELTGQLEATLNRYAPKTEDP